MIGFVLLIAVESIPLPPTPQLLILGPASPVFASYVACLSKGATELEPSNGSTDEIFQASVTACEQKPWSTTFTDLKSLLLKSGKLTDGQAHRNALDAMREQLPRWQENQRLTVLRARVVRNVR